MTLFAYLVNSIHVYTIKSARDPYSIHRIVTVLKPKARYPTQSIELSLCLNQKQDTEFLDTHCAFSILF
jgi:hypothetical protein